MHYWAIHPVLSIYTKKNNDRPLSYGSCCLFDYIYGYMVVGPAFPLRLRLLQWTVVRGVFECYWAAG